MTIPFPKTSASRFASVLLCSALFLSFNPAAEARIIRVGISEFADYSVNLPVIPATIKVIESTFGPENVSVRIYPVAALQSAAKQGAVDLILSSAGTYRRLSIEGAGVHNLAAVASNRVTNPNYADASVFFTLKDRSDITSIADLKGRTVAANHRFAFSGWQTAMGELFRRGLPGESLFGKVLFQGHDMTKVVDAVRSGAAGAGIVRACYLEDMSIPIDDFKILDPREKAGFIDCVRSTDLYPNWTISSLPTLTSEESRKLIAALFAMPAVGDGVHWSIATDFRGIDKLFWDLKIGPYEYLQHFSLRRFISRNWPYFAIAFTLLIALILHSATVSRLVRIRTRELEASLEREKIYEKESQEAQNRFQALQKVGIIGQMSSIVAHEMRQPLSSILLYTHGILRRLEGSESANDAVVKTLGKIQNEAKRASAIVDQVRAYARGQAPREPIELHPVVRQSIGEAKKSLRRFNVAIAFNDLTPQDIWIEASALEVELILVNLIKNAAEANAGAPTAEITVDLGMQSPNARLAVVSRGNPVSDEDWAALQRGVLRSTKDGGLGLGLSIVRSITDSIGGSIGFTKLEGGALMAEILVPLCAAPAEASQEKTDVQEAADPHR